MSKARATILSLLAAAMFGCTAFAAAALPVRAADVTSVGQVQALFETENTAAFSISGSTNNIVVTQDPATVKAVSPTSPGGDGDDTHNQTTTITYKNPIYIGDNSDEVPFFSYSWMDQDKDASKRDFDALIVTLTDTEDATNQVSVLIGAWSVADGWQTTSSTVYARGSGQTYKGYHYNNDSTKSLGSPVNQGTMTDGAIDKYPDSVWELYYDNDSKQVLINYGWPNYSSRGGVVTNGAGKQLTLVRDLTDTTTSGADTAAFDKDMQTAYLSVTTVRGWFKYDNIGTSTIYSKAFRNGGSTHTLSEQGAQYMIRSIDGINFGLGASGDLMQDSAPVYLGSRPVSGAGTVQIPAMNRYTVLSGITPDKEYTQNLYIEVTDEDGTPVQVVGLQDGKWTEESSFAGENGSYTISYYSDAAKETPAAQVTATLYRLDFTSAEKIAAPDIFEGTESTFGWENIRVGKSALYSGVTVSTGVASTVVFKKDIDIDISDNTKDDVLLEFIAIPHEVGVADFTSITFKFSDKNDPDTFFTVKLGSGPYGSTGMGGLLAAGDNQKGYGLKLIRENDEYDGDTGSVLSQTLGGESSGPNIYSSICLYYDRTENALYTSQMYNYSNTQAQKSLVRDFDDTTLKINKAGATVSQEAWGGFTSDTVTLEITVDTVSEGETAKYGILTVDGERFTKRLSTTFAYDGIEGYEYRLPAPVYVSGLTGAETDFNSVGSGMRVLLGDEEIPVVGGVFTPGEAGSYTVQYVVDEGGKTYLAEFPLTVYAKDAAPAVDFHLTGGVGEGDVIYLGGGMTGNVTASTKLHHDGSLCPVTAQLKKDGESVAGFVYENGTFSHEFGEVGEYMLVFTAVDQVGRESVKEISFTVSRTSVALADPEDLQTLLDRTDTIGFSAEDVAVTDVHVEDGQTVSKPQSELLSLQVTIDYAFGDGEFTPWSPDADMSALGDYKIRYSVSYRLVADGEVYTSEFVRTVKVVDNTPPELGEAAAPEGNVKQDMEQSTDAAQYYRAMTGGTITIAQLGATDARADAPVDLSSAVKARLTDADKQVTDITFTDETFTFTPEKAGTYYVTFTVSDGVLEDTFVYVFEVRSVWLSASFESDTLADAEYGKAYTLPSPAFTDFNGDSVTGVQVRIEIVPQGGGTPVTAEGNSFTPDATGTFTVRYTMSHSGETVVKEFTLTVKDVTAPVISFAEEVPGTAYVGETFVLPAVTVTDDRDKALGYTIWLEFEGTRTELFDLSFRPEQTGTYKIVIETSDTAGNPASVSAEITVTERPAPDYGWVIAVCCVAGVLVIGGLVTTIVLMKKKHSAKPGKSDK